jgi:hypothetical protein
VCGAWNAFQTGSSIALGLGSEVACGAGAAVTKAQCNLTANCTQDPANGYPGGPTQIAITNYVGGTQTNNQYNGVTPPGTGLNPCTPGP